ncbi:LLM class flavin-dependent oxidoreductase [Ancylobacter sp. Lp-2]|uniref:LLM class flavin-dependent oxidoreductase n=1 Tax=Ancylobacter sp. Lp-2 TaxID=2881339 RepID=UPI001E2CEF48|nr:LLM class flavin-dependent oxidoreductase [Ancylobacter sp. Lp-2]MCB4768650.1 LLM class flavin-dependent oxidoreductase [Ancylobacter sp. Lp-2]
MSARTLHLNINILNSGFHSGAWRAPAADARDFLDIGHYIRAARTAERGTFDAVFLADTPSFSDRPEYRPFNALEPTVILTAIAASTSHIGLIGTASTSYNDPYNLARRFASLDLVSGGRAGWNVVTTADSGASRNFGFDGAAAHADRYERAAEFTEVVKALWGSWEPDAFIGDKASGRFVDVSRVHPIEHRGRHFRVRGPLSVPGSAQGRPVIVQAGGSGDGRHLAALHADAIFSVAHTPEEAIAFADDVRARAHALGRRDPIVFLPGLGTTLASTEAEALRRQRELLELIDPVYAVARVAGLLQVDPDRLSLDAPLPDDLAPPPDGMQTFAAATLALARRDRLTVRDLVRILGGSTGHRLFVGTPEQLADDIEHWFLAGAADGFNLMPDVVTDGLEIFVDHVVPLLRRKGIFRSHYEEATLRERLGLEPPARAAADAEKIVAAS